MLGTRLAMGLRPLRPASQIKRDISAMTKVRWERFSQVRPPMAAKMISRTPS